MPVSVSLLSLCFWNKCNEMNGYSFTNHKAKRNPPRFSSAYHKGSQVPWTLFVLPTLKPFKSKFRACLSYLVRLYEFTTENPVIILHIVTVVLLEKSFYLSTWFCHSTIEAKQAPLFCSPVNFYDLINLSTKMHGKFGYVLLKMISTSLWWLVVKILENSQPSASCCSNGLAIMPLRQTSDWPTQPPTVTCSATECPRLLNNIMDLWKDWGDWVQYNDGGFCLQRFKMQVAI